MQTGAWMLLVTALLGVASILAVYFGARVVDGLRA